MRCEHCQHMNRAEAVYCGRCGLRLTDAIGLAPPIPPPLSLQLLKPGTRLGAHGRFQIAELLGSGGFGQAYRAVDLGLHGRQCVIKRLVIERSVPPEDREQIIIGFQREARLLGALATPGHPAIPDAYDYLPHDYCLVMKYVAGKSLAMRLAHRIDGLPEHEVIAYGRAICSALAYMHQRADEPVLHRDVKPENVVLDSEGHVWLIDFGVSQILAARAPEPDERSQLAGTPGYTPPEQWRGHAEPRSDVYALAMTLVRLLTNRHLPPIFCEAAEIVAMLPPTIRPDLRGLLQRGAALDVADRPSTAEFLAALSTIDQETPPPSPPLPLPSAQTFVGRRSELSDLGQRLQRDRLLALIGFAGVGKTTLAARLAAELAPTAPVLWYQCQPSSDSDAFLHQMAECLAWHGQPQLWHSVHRQLKQGERPPGEARIDAALAALAGQRLLICIDDAHLVANDPGFARIFAGLDRMARARQALVLLTARRRCL